MAFLQNSLRLTNGQWGYQALVLLLIAPLLEEFVMRAGLHHALTRRASGSKAQARTRMVIVALIFGVLHLYRSFWLALAVIPVGLLLGLIYERSRSWKRCALVHSFMNAIWVSFALVAVPAHADALRGKTLYATVPSGALSCSTASACHGVDPTKKLNKILNGANNPALITSAIANNTGGMGMLNGKWTATDIGDIAQYLGNPGVTAGTPAASISTSTLSFAATTLNTAAANQTVTLSNTGSGPLTVSAVSLSGTTPGDFSTSGSGACVAGGSLAAGTSCTVSVGFTPLAVGARSATLALTHALGTSSVSLSGSGTGIAQAAVSPGTLTFASTILNTAAATQQVTLINSGSGPLSVSGVGLAGANSGDFSATGSGACAGGSLAAGTSCTVTVGFTPLVIGARSASLVVSHALGQSAVALNGSGAAVPQPTISLNQNLLAFGAVTQGTTSTVQSVVITNSGQAPLTLTSMTVSGVSTGIYTQAGTCIANQAIAVNGTCTIDLRFSPNAIATFNGLLTLVSNASNGTVSLTLQGNGVAVPAPVIGVSPASLAFGNQTTGGVSGTQIVNIQNTGNATATISSVVLSGSTMFALNSSGCTGSLGAGASCSLQVQFKPTVAGAATGTIAVTTNAAGSPHSVSVSGTGVSTPTPSPAISQTGIMSFAGTTVGQSTSAQIATASNAGTAAYLISQISLSGTNPADFVLGGTCVTGLSLASSSTCSVSVAFAPSAVGLRQARVNLVTNGGTTLGFDVQGSGTAVATISGQLSPANTSLGSVLVGNTSAIQRIALNNTGNQSLNVSAISVSAPFTQISDSTTCATPPFSLSPGIKCDIAIRVAPSSTGNLTGTVRVTTSAPGPDLTATLSAIGTNAATAAPPPPGGGGAQTTPASPGNTGGATTGTTTGGTTDATAGASAGSTTTAPAAATDPNTNAANAVKNTQGGAPLNAGMGGCTISPDGNDASMVLLLLAALLTGLYRGSFTSTKSSKVSQPKES